MTSKWIRMHKCENLNWYNDSEKLFGSISKNTAHTFYDTEILLLQKCACVLTKRQALSAITQNRK